MMDFGSFEERYPPPLDLRLPPPQKKITAPLLSFFTTIYHLPFEMGYSL